MSLKDLFKKDEEINLTYNEKMEALKKIKQKKNSEEKNKIENEKKMVIDYHNELLELRKEVEKFLNIYKEYKSEQDINKDYNYYLGNNIIQIANGGICIGMICSCQTITITDKEVKYDIAREFNGKIKYKTNDVDKLLENLNSDVYGIVACMQRDLINGMEEYIEKINNEIEKYIKENEGV